MDIPIKITTFSLFLRFPFCVDFLPFIWVEFQRKAVINVYKPDNLTKKREPDLSFLGKPFAKGIKHCFFAYI